LEPAFTGFGATLAHCKRGKTRWADKTEGLFVGDFSSLRAAVSFSLRIEDLRLLVSSEQCSEPRETSLALLSVADPVRWRIMRFCERNVYGSNRGSDRSCSDPASRQRTGDTPSTPLNSFRSNCSGGDLGNTGKKLRAEKVGYVARCISRIRSRDRVDQFLVT
jgi:hypothetical protein